MVWQITATSVPGLAVVLILYVLGSLDALPAMLGAILAFLFAIPATLLAADELKRLGAWLEALASGKPSRHPLAIRHAAVEFIVRPALALTRRVRAVEQINTNRQAMIEQVVDALPDPIMLVDAETKVIRANPAAQRNFSDFAPNIALPRLIRDPDLLAAVTAATEGRAPTTLSYRPTADRHEEYFARVEPIILPDGGSGALIALREQTEQLMIERIRSDFVANASHEIKTPLASLQGFIETLQGPAQHDPETRQSFLDTMAEETSRLARLVCDLLSLSHIELSATDLPVQPCDLDLIIGRVVDRLAPIAKTYSVQLIRTGRQSLPTVLGDQDQIHQLLVNLVDNAIKYGGHGKRVMIEAGLTLQAPVQTGPMAGRPAVYVAVTDEGGGISPVQLPRLTERFYRVDKARSRQVGGTGLGLAIVKHIVLRHRGYLDIRSELGVGSCFRVYLPLDQKGEQSAIE